MLRLAVVSLARLERVLGGAGRLQGEGGCWGAPMPQGCSGYPGDGLSPHPPPGVALGGIVLPALAHRCSGKCTGTSGGLSVGAASSPTRPSSELQDLTSWGVPFLIVTPEFLMHHNSKVSGFMEVPRYRRSFQTIRSNEDCKTQLTVLSRAVQRCLCPARDVSICPQRSGSQQGRDLSVCSPCLEQ